MILFCYKNTYKKYILNTIHLLGHKSRVLNLAMSPDGETVVSAGADETLRLWNCFATDPKKKKVVSKETTVRSDIMKNRIR